MSGLAGAMAIFWIVMGIGWVISRLGDHHLTESERFEKARKASAKRRDAILKEMEGK